MKNSMQNEKWIQSQQIGRSFALLAGTKLFTPPLFVHMALPLVAVVMVFFPQASQAAERGDIVCKTSVNGEEGSIGISQVSNSSYGVVSAVAYYPGSSAQQDGIHRSWASYDQYNRVDLFSWAKKTAIENGIQIGEVKLVVHSPEKGTLSLANFMLANGRVTNLQTAALFIGSGENSVRAGNMICRYIE